MSDIRILDVSFYMYCPPKSGGVLRMLAPLSKMSSECGITIDFVFGVYDDQYGLKCAKYVERIPVVRRAEYVLFEPGKLLSDQLPADISEDVWRTMSRSLLDSTIRMVRSERYDIIQLEHSFLAWMAPYLREASPHSKLVLDAHNIEYRIFELWNKYNPSSQMDERAKVLREWEYTVWNWFDAVLTVSPVESDIIRSASNVQMIYEVPTGGGIDLNKYEPKETTAEKPYDILFIGTLEWYPNTQGLLWFLDNVFPIVQEKRPGTKFYIIGSGMPDSNLVNKANSLKDVEFLGFQPDDVYYFHHSKVFVVPLWIGAGARVKIPTAWASRIPVVSTTFGAEGNGAVNGKNVLLADDPEAFADSILRILDSPELGETISENALEHIEQHLTVNRCAELLVDAYHSIAKNQ